MAQATAVAPRRQRPRVAILLRVSDPRQARADRFSVDAQRRSLIDLCDRHAWEIVREYVGAGESAYTRHLGKRPTIVDMLAEVAYFDILAVHEIGRFARNEELGHAVVNLLDDHGIRLVSATTDIDYSTPEGRMMLSNELGLNAYWSRKMSFHIRKSKRERFELGLHVSDVPCGYEKGATNRDPLVLVLVEAVAIREGFRDRAAGCGYVEIARRWNAMGLKPRSKRGHTLFTVSAVQSILENDFYAGFVRHKGDRKRGLHEAIVSEELFLAAQARVRHQPTKAREPRLLAGFAVCMACGGPIWQHKGGTHHTYAYYREGSQRQGRTCAAAGVWSCDDAEAEVDAVVSAMSADAEWLADVDRDARRSRDVVDDSERRALGARKARATNAYVNGAMLEGEWRRTVVAIDERIAHLPVPITRSLAFAGEKLNSIGQVWDVMTPGEKREACRILFEKVAMEVRQHESRLKPWPEFEALFVHRRELCGHGTPGRTRTCAHGLGNHCSIL